MRRPDIAPARLGPLAALMMALGPASALGGEEAWRANPGLIPKDGFVLFFGVQGPLSYAALTPKDLPAGAEPAGEVRGRGCQHGLALPLGLRGPRLSGAAGRGGFERALSSIRERHPGLRGVYDVKVDDHIVSVLGLYRRICTEVLARGFR